MELVIQACEGGFYLANLNLKGRDERTGRANLEIKRFNSLNRVREYFDDVAPKDVWLCHNVAYDEMIGLPSNESEVRQRLYWYQ